jgi:thiol:disulfide interchange protein DsbD
MTLFRRTWFLFFWLAVHGAAFAQLHEVGDGSDGPVKGAHVTAELSASVPASSPQGSSQIALILHLESGWHVYWVNAGDSGEAPNVDWVLPTGVTVGKMQFPTPKRLPLGSLMDYGYEGTTVFPFELKLDGTSRVSDSSEGVESNPVTHLKTAKAP